MEPKLSRDCWEIFATGVDHPECVAFDAEGQLWAGGEAGQIYKIDRAGKVTQVADLGGFVGGVAVSPDRFIMACCPSRGLVRVQADGQWDIFATHAGEQRLICPNFGVFDSNRNYFVTESGNWGKHNGSLLRFDPAGTGKKIAGPFGYANGLALSAGERTLFMIESDFDRIWRFELDMGGEVQSQEIFAEQIGRMPDGLALDSAGNLYASCYASDEIWQISPDRQKNLFAWDRWAILLSRPTNMAFDPRDPEMMYVANLGRTTITRARTGTPGQMLVNCSEKKYGQTC